MKKRHFRLSNGWPLVKASQDRPVFWLGPVKGPNSAIEAANFIIEHWGRPGDVHALTDVTGFGLLGHLLEMLRASDMNAVLDPEAIPALDSALLLLGSGVTSSLHADNLAALAALDPEEALETNPIGDC